MQDAVPNPANVVAVLSLASVLLVGLLPSRHEPSSPLFAAQRWSHRDLVILLIVLIGIHVVPGSAVPRLMPLWVFDGLSALFITASIWTVVRRYHSRPWQALGLDRRTAYYETLWSLRIGLGVVSFLAVLVLSVRLAVHAIPATPGRFVWHDRIGEFIGAVAVSTVLFPVAEELLFRGLAYVCLFRRLGPAGASAGTAALWAAAHYGTPTHNSFIAFFGTFVFGLVYAELYRRQESLVPPLVFHIVGNTMALFIRDRTPITLLWLAGTSSALWIVSILLFTAVNRSRDPKTRVRYVKHT